MTLLSDVEGFETGDADVPATAFIQPPQVYIDNVEYAILQLSAIHFGSSTALLLQNKGITEFHLDQTYHGPNIFLPNSCTLNLQDNKMDSSNVKGLFALLRNYLDAYGSTGWFINAYGLEMGTPLEGGVVGGWEIELVSYIPGTETGLDIYVNDAAYSYLNRQIYLDPSQPYAGSYDEGTTTFYIGVSDNPTNTQILNKVAQLYAAINPFGSYSVVGDKLTYVDTVARTWIVAPFLPDFIGDGDGENASNPDIQYLTLTLGCTGYYTAIDGITRVEFN